MQAQESSYREQAEASKGAEKQTKSISMVYEGRPIRR
jgi:hypothetical protein